MMTVTDDFLLLVHNGTTGRPRLDASTLPIALAGAVLLDLAIAGRVAIAEKGDPLAGRVVVVPGPPLGHPVLDDALSTLSSDKPRTPKTFLSQLSKNITPAVFSSLEARGLVSRSEVRALGLVTFTAWPATSTTVGEEARQRLSATLVLGQDPDATTSAIVALLLATNTLHKALPDQYSREVKRRAKEIADASWATDGVRSAITAVQTETLVMVGAMLAVASGWPSSS